MNNISIQIRKDILSSHIREEENINNIILFQDPFYIFHCPHADCKLLISVHKDEINCMIFRHAIYKNNLQQINPHTSKEECEKLKNQDLIIGCGKPFKFNKNIVEICDYM